MACPLETSSKPREHRVLTVARDIAEPSEALGRSRYLETCARTGPVVERCWIAV